MFQTTNQIYILMYIPSGNLLHSYWKWPSRNSEFTHSKYPIAIEHEKIREVLGAPSQLLLQLVVVGDLDNP